MIVKLGLLVMAFLSLVAYSALLLFFDNENKLGIIITVAIICMDVFNFALYNSNMVDTPGEIIFLFMINRVLMIFLGQDYWIYGFMILYILYAVTFVILIARFNFPYEGDITPKELKLNDIQQQNKLTQSTLISLAKKGGRSPKLLLLVITIFYIALLFIIRTVKIDGVEIKPF